jgi:hypothetical protein
VCGIEETIHKEERMNHSRSLAFLFVFFSVALAVALPPGGGSSSQKTHRGFEGKVTNENGNFLTGVRITLIDVDAEHVEEIRNTRPSDDRNGLSANTSKHGRYKFLAVRPGLYRIRYELAGYQTLEKLVRFERSAKDAVMNIKLKQLTTEAPAAGGN